MDRNCDSGLAGDKNQADGGDCFACNCSGRNIFFAKVPN